MATGRELRSRKVRSIPDRAILHDQGNSLRVYRLSGHISFGSAHPVVRRNKQTLRDGPPPACILLDFSMVSGFDIAAVNTFCEFIRSAHAQATQVVICAASRLFRDDLEPRVYRSGETLSARPRRPAEILVTGRVSTYDADEVRLSQHGPAIPSTRRLPSARPRRRSPRGRSDHVARCCSLR